MLLPDQAPSDRGMMGCADAFLGRWAASSPADHAGSLCERVKQAGRREPCLPSVPGSVLWNWMWKGRHTKDSVEVTESLIP